MDEEQFILLSMKDSKQVADALANKTAQKILSYIAEHKEATESELAEKLETPLPTIHYNIEQLKKANLLRSKEFFWSKKGKKMRVFILAKKYIIISPEKSKSALKQLKDLLPIMLISVIAAGFVQFYQNAQNGFRADVSDAAFPMIAKESIAQDVAQTTIQQPNLVMWFLLGAGFAIVVTLIYNFLKK